MASFVEKDELYEAIESISKNSGVPKENIFIFVNENDLNEYILTYNMNSENANIKFTSIWKNTISIHRKKQTNTLYSLNAMNELIKMKNNGVLNKSYKIKWDEYENKMLIIKRRRLVIFPIRLVKINN